MNSDLKSLESFLNDVKNHITPVGETTIFALGGRSYYENPASDLLKFFLSPDAEHGLKDLFLSTFLECIGDGHRQFDMSCVDIQREVRTANQNKIDLRILGRDWCLLIENKIYHWQANPFKDYEAHAEQFLEKTKFFSILSPDGTVSPVGSANPNRWKGVSYKDYCQKLREKLATKFFDTPFSKWNIFAREFILHIENELGLNNLPMKPEDAKFVEDNADKFVEAQKLEQQYREFVCEELKRQLEASVSGHTFNVKVEWFGFRCFTPQWGESHVVLLKSFYLRAYLYLEDISEPHQSSAMEALNLGPNGGCYTDGGRKYRMWDSVVGFDSREKAIAKLCECAKIVNGLIKQ